MTKPRNEKDEEPVIVGYVLAGGMSSRFGADKALAEIGGASMLARMIELLHGWAKHICVVGGTKKYGHFKTEVIEDRWPGGGPLGGIITALLHTKERKLTCEWNLILSCDMPFLTEAWVKFLAGKTESSKASVILPQSASGPEPLCACWRTEAAETLLPAFEAGVRKVMDGVKLLREEVLDEADWKRFDNFANGGRLFWNMNTPEDYEAARRILETGHK